MELTHEFTVSAPIEETWALLLDLERIAPCMPGAELQEVVGDEYRGAFVGDDAPYFLETSQPGIFAVGDVRSGSIKRVASGAGEGAMAVQLVHHRLAGR